jgi:hypothetical protein
LLAVAACASQASRPRAAPAVTAPADAVPADLDVVVRIDVAGVRDAIGSTAFALLSARAKQSAAGMDPGSERLLVDLLAHADTLWLAFRPNPDTEHTDNVVILRGRFERIDPASYGSAPAWQSSEDLGGGWRRYERSRPRSRSAPARVLMRGDELVVLASYAELDSLELALEGRQPSRALAAPESGTFSLAARVRALADSLRARSAAAARLLDQAATLQVTVSLASSGLNARLSVDFQMDDQAHRAAEATNLLLRALAEGSETVAGLLPSVRVEAVGSALVITANVDRDHLGALATCSVAGTCP